MNKEKKIIKGSEEGDSITPGRWPEPDWGGGWGTGRGEVGKQ